MSVTTEAVLHAAEVAALRLDHTEAAQLAEHLSRLLHRLAALDELDLEGVESLARPEPDIDSRGLLRADERGPSLGSDVALANAPDRYNSYFVVPNMMGAAADD